MSILDDILTVLQASSELSDLLAGGLHSAMEISRQLTPTAFDENKEVLPCGLLKARDEIPVGPYADSVQTPIVIFLYERRGYATVEAADMLIFGLLNQKKIGAATWQVAFDGTLYRTYDDVLQCPAMQSRYHVTRRKI